jgi:hypothetical protein
MVAEAMDAIQDHTSLAFLDLSPHYPPTFVEIHNRRDHFLSRGEFCCLNEPTELVATEIVEGERMCQYYILLLLK